MAARSTSEVDRDERCALFIVMIKGSNLEASVADASLGEEIFPTVPIVRQQSDGSPDSALWSGQSGRVIARVWPGNALRNTVAARTVQRGLKLAVGCPVRTDGRALGHFSMIDLDSAGHGHIQQDPYGLHPLYLGRVRGITLIANRPHLIAAVLKRLSGEQPRRDRRFAAWLALSGYPIGDRTGYEQVRCVPFGACVQVRRGFRVRFPSVRPPWLAREYARETGSADAMIDRIESELIINLRDAIADMGHVPRLQLTGGRDSRLMLALALRGGLLQDVEVVTLGQPDSPDATVARELTRRLDIGHSQLQWNDGVVVRRQLCPHVGTVAGAVSCDDSSISLSTDGRMTLSGLTGEMLRTNWPNRIGYRDEQSAVAGFLSMPLGKVGLLRRNACLNALTDGIRCLLAPAAQGAGPEDLFDAYYIQHRLRRWLAARPERFADEFFPLYHPAAVELAFRMGWRARAAGRIHNRIIERAGSRVSQPLYYKPGGFYQVKEIADEPDQEIHYRGAGRFRDSFARRLLHLGRDSVRLHEPAVTEWLSDVYSKERPLSIRTDGGLQHSFLPRQKDAYREPIAARDDNPIFEVIDRDRLIAAVHALHKLTGPAAREVHGAMTGVIWLGRLEEES